MLFRFDIVHARHARSLRSAQRVLCCVALLCCAFLAPTTLAQDRGVSDWATPDDQCVPTCRDGYECRRGECSPICNPPCGPGLLCTGGGQCVRVESQSEPPPSRRRSTPTDACVPSCRSGFTCLDGACVSMCNPVCPRGEVCNQYGECLPDDDEPAPLQSLPDEEEPEPAPEGDPLRDSIANVHVDALGPLQFGLTPTIEVGKRFAGYARLRALNTGLMSYFLLGRDREDELDWGLGGTLGMHVFSQRGGNLRGFFGGPALEYVFVRTRDTKRDFATYRTHALVPQADFGYRWGFKHLLLGVGLRLGLSIPLHERIDPRGSAGCRRPDSCDQNLDVDFLPGLFLDLGYFIPKRR